MTEFQKNVYEAVREIPKGSTATYREIAEMAGRPRAWRAVGTILSQNYDPAIPCHRVIRSDGKIGGYNRGIENKRKLLTEEKPRN